MRREFAKFISETVKKDQKIQLLSLDGPGYGLFNKLEEENPQNYWNLGVTEQASIGWASGMALEGLKPYVYSITPFVLERPLEQIKLNIVHQKANVKIVGFWNYPNDGITHRTEDVVGLCKALKLNLFEPKNSKETREILEETYKSKIPAFISLTKDFVI